MKEGHRRIISAFTGFSIAMIIAFALVLFSSCKTSYHAQKYHNEKKEDSVACSITNIIQKKRSTGIVAVKDSMLFREMVITTYYTRDADGVIYKSRTDSTTRETSFFRDSLKEEATDTKTIQSDSTSVSTSSESVEEKEDTIKKESRPSWKIYVFFLIVGVVAALGWKRN